MTDPEEYVPLITCLMEIPAFDPQAAVDCLENLEISSTTAEAITECAMTDEGSNLLHDVGVETQNLDPAMYFVPWFLFNDVITTDLCFYLFLYFFRFLTRTYGIQV